MAIKPILFNTEMVRAIQNGTKTVTRRVIKRQPDGVNEIKHPYQVGDILWVRETWSTIGEWTCVDPDVGMFDGYLYKADWISADHPRWHPSIHMPREAARIFLLITEVRRERLKEMTNISAMKEGFTDWNDAKRIWNSTIKPCDLPLYDWDANPPVRVITFEPCEKPENF